MDKKVLKNAEFYVGLGMLAVFFVVLWQISVINVPESRLFPIFIAIVILMSSFVQFYKVFVKKEYVPVSDVKIHLKEFLMILILLASYPLYEVLGFYATLLPVVFGISLVMLFPLDRHSLLFCIAYSLIVLLVCFISFYFILGLITPEGVLI